MINKGYKVIFPKRENAIVIMGPTGAGKSTLTSYFAGLDLIAN